MKFGSGITRYQAGIQQTIRVQETRENDRERSNRPNLYDPEARSYSYFSPLVYTEFYQDKMALYGLGYTATFDVPHSPTHYTPPVSVQRGSSWCWRWIPVLSRLFHQEGRKQFSLFIDRTKVAQTRVISVARKGNWKFIVLTTSVHWEKKKVENTMYNNVITIVNPVQSRRNGTKKYSNIWSL